MPCLPFKNGGWRMVYLFFYVKCITLGFMLVIFFFFVIGIGPVIFFNGIGGVVIRTLVFFSVLFFFFFFSCSFSIFYLLDVVIMNSDKL
jgi:hypothetical protein